MVWTSGNLCKLAAFLLAAVFLISLQVNEVECDESDSSAAAAASAAAVEEPTTSPPASGAAAAAAASGSRADLFGSKGVHSGCANYRKFCCTPGGRKCKPKKPCKCPPKPKPTPSNDAPDYEDAEESGESSEMSPRNAAEVLTILSCTRDLATNVLNGTIKLPAVCCQSLLFKLLGICGNSGLANAGSFDENSESRADHSLSSRTVKSAKIHTS